MITPPEYQVVIIEGLKEPFEQWLASRNLHLFPIPARDDDLPVFGVGLGAR